MYEEFLATLLRVALRVALVRVIKYLWELYQRSRGK